MSSLLINGTAPTALQLAAIRADLGLGAGNPGSKMWNAYSDREIVTNQNLGGNYHIYNTDGLIGPNTTHYIKCVEANAAGTQANGHSLHVGGAIIVNDR